LADPVGVRDTLATLLETPPLCHLTPESRGTAELVLAEVLNNVAEHAYADRPGPVTVTLTPVAAGIHCSVVDEGTAMPGGRLPDGNLRGGPGTALEDLPEGGFGWHLIRALSRDLTYLRSDGRNRLSFLLPYDG
jgi:serine/threonine-protein kinase RsbW